MWRGAAIFLLLTVLINSISAKYFSEAGTYHVPAKQPDQFEQAPIASQYYDVDLNRDNLSPYRSNDEDQRLAGIVDELRQLQPDEDQQVPAYDMNGMDNSPNDRLDWDALKDLPEVPNVQEKEKPEEISETESKTPLTAQKKGQSEFVEFVERPLNAKALKAVPAMDKRVPVESSKNVNAIHTLNSSGNIVFIAIVTMCCIVVVVGVVGGAYYYNNMRKNSDNTFDDFTRYSPAGPGRDKKQKKRGGSGGNITENGDESLAYKAQLHHYQQTKQKIIGAEEGIAGIAVEGEDDKSDDELEEHNFSVYECPGLAPTGDIEVQNPNFDIKHHNASSP